jgi:outer membrane protein assembly factor BamB
MKAPACSLITALAFVCSPGTGSAQQSWPQFRGINGAGLAIDAKPPVRFGPTENVLWSVEAPWSPSSLCIWGERIFLTTFHDGELQTRCYDCADGKLRWARGIKPPGIEEYHRSDGSPAASTPATDGRKVVSYFGSFGVICHDFEGKELWRHVLPAAESYGQYGSGASPIIVGDSVLVNRDQYRYSSLLALDIETGATRWETPRPDAGGSFGTPFHWRNNGIDEIVLGGSARLKGYDMRTGAERWTIDGITGLVCTTPVVAGDILIFAAWSNAVANSSLPSWAEFARGNDRNGDGQVTFDEIATERRDYLRGLDVNRDGKLTKEDWELMKVRNARAENLLIAVGPGGRGDISGTHVAWRHRQGLPYVASPLYYEGRVYFVKDGGLISSLDAKTGEPFYSQVRLPANGNYYASPVAAAGRIYVASLPGKLTVVKAGGAQPEILYHVDFGERIFATPALVGDRIYLRTEKKLWAFGKQAG